MRIAIAELYTHHFDDWAPIVTNNKQEYCDRHGYSLVTKRDLYKNYADRHPSWHSILLIKEILETTDVDWVFWSDIDALIMNYDVRLEDFIVDDKDIVIPNQGRGIVEYGSKDSCLCCGNYFIKNTQWSKDILQEIWDWPEKYKKWEFVTLRYWEQCAMNYMWNNNIMNFEDHVYIEPYNRAFNAFYSFNLEQKEKISKGWSLWGEEMFNGGKSGMHYIKGDFILHFAGCSRGNNIAGLITKYSKMVRK
jgi:hypothetical protein